MPRTATAHRPAPTAASILALVQAIETQLAGAPAAIAFRAALARKGREAAAAGGSQALNDLRRAVAMADPGRAEARSGTLTAAWAGLTLLSSKGR